MRLVGSDNRTAALCFIFYSVNFSIQFSNHLTVKLFVYAGASQFLSNKFSFSLDPSGPHHSDGSARQREGGYLHPDCCCWWWRTQKGLHCGTTLFLCPFSRTVLIRIPTYNAALHCVCFVIERLKAFLFCSLLLSLEVQKVRDSAFLLSLTPKTCVIFFQGPGVFESRR